MSEALSPMELPVLDLSAMPVVSIITE
jgi:hypothetical protein